MATWGEAKAIIKNDLDLVDETFIDDTMLDAWGNAAIDEAEKHILAINEDYFLQTADVPLVEGESLIALPTGILGYKIRKLFYDNGAQRYEIKRIRKLTDVPNVHANDGYRYLMVNVAGTGARMKLFPASRETSSANATVWFIGNANRIVDDDTELDIPEALNFIITYVKLECLRREGNPGQASMQGERERQRTLLIESLSDMVPDEDNEIQIDTSFYDEME